jgi:hypothetical protein
VLIGFDYFNYDSAAVGVVLGVLLLWIGNRVPHPTKSMQIMVLVFVVTGLGFGLYNQLNLIGYGVARESFETLSLTIRAYMATWMVPATLIFTVAILAFRMPRGALVLSVALVICGSIMWDNRSPFQKYMENHIGKPSPLGDYIPPKAEVFWSDDLRLLWFILDRPSYFSRNQAAGLVFKRATAMAFLEHEENGLPLKTSNDICEALDRMGSHCGINADSIHDVCKPGSADFVVVSRYVEDMLPNRTFKVNLEGAPSQSYDVYNCRALIEHKTAHPKSQVVRRVMGMSPGAGASALSSSASISNVPPVKTASERAASAS